MTKSLVQKFTVVASFAGAGIFAHFGSEVGTYIMIGSAVVTIMEFWEDRK